MQDLLLHARRCAVNNTVVASVLPGPSALPVILPLAHSAAAAGFACIVVQPYETLTLAAEDGRLLLQLPAPSRPLLPRRSWCNGSQYEYRRGQFHRMRLWRTLLDAGYDVLGLDASRRLVRNPLPALAAMRTRNEAQYGWGSRPDVVGMTPGWFLKQYGLHTMWIRSTERTRAMVRRAEARTFGGWDELVFTEELNWGDHANMSSLPCCHAECLGKQFKKEPVVKVAAPRRRAGASASSCAADDSPPLAPHPPNASRHAWADPAIGMRRRYGTARDGRPLYQLAWWPERYNTLQIPMHRFGRCTGRDASCVGLHEHCPPPPPPFTRETALAGKRAEAAAAKARGLRHRAERAAREQKRKG